MKQILIRHGDDIDPEDAMRYAYKAWKGSEERTGIVTFTDDTVVVFSERSKNPSMTVWREKK